jgi:hypothetical protein
MMSYVRFGRADEEGLLVVVKQATMRSTKPNSARRYTCRGGGCSAGESR